VTGTGKRKGDLAEREAADLLSDLLGVNARRMLGAGRLDDVGDIDGVPNTTVQVVNRVHDVVAVGVVAKPIQAGEQAINAGNLHAVTMVRIRGGTWRMVMTPEQWATMWREATSPDALRTATVATAWHAAGDTPSAVVLDEIRRSIAAIDADAAARADEVPA
jgi:hypothetical protein